MLIALALPVAVTAFVAGLAGAWSPCGLSMVDTIGSALGDSGRRASQIGCATFTVGALVGGVITFVGLALLGTLLGADDALRGALGALIALGAAVADWRGVRVMPQIRRQVPESWRWKMPLAQVSALYGLLLGLGFTTFVLAFAVWAVAGISFVLASPTLGAVIGLSFAAGRCGPVLWMAPGRRTRDDAPELERLALEPRLWLGIRRVGAMGLTLCALLLFTASAGAQPLSGNYPSAAASAFAWQPPSGSGILRLGSRAFRVPGQLPAVSSTSIAWVTPRGVMAAPLPDDGSIEGGELVSATRRVTAISLSPQWLVYRYLRGGRQYLAALAMPTSPGAPAATPLRLAGPQPPGSISAPSVSGDRVAFALNDAAHSVIRVYSLAEPQPRLDTSFNARLGEQLNSPALYGRRLLYVRDSRCTQNLVLGGLGGNGRALRSLHSTSAHDYGFQPGYEVNWNSASLCPGGYAWRPSRYALRATALDASRAYVVYADLQSGRSTIRAIAR